MKRLVQNLILLLSTTCFLACSKKEKTPLVTDQNPSYSNYSRLQKGSYWIYESYMAWDTVITKGVIDSCYISKDTVIGHNRFYKYVDANHPDLTSFLRDSLHYIINSKGEIIFSSQNFTDVLRNWCVTSTTNDTLSKTWLQMKDKDALFTVPAGVFETCNAVTTTIFYLSQDPEIRVTHRRYAKNIGLIHETYPSLVTSGRNLIRYGKH